ncbi:hypothetical protein [Solibacillus isronensis]|uniref:hypothetical protein n=1 Tax=Solibacillus isronensis TaxID=412383 RepID=UPI00203CBA29|nr:hypothetical protein [Solibacillus isronensis]MCM3721171.1 hypothetical protein [Solibacillus isronensis]
MKKITTILSFVFISIILFGCQQSNDKKLDNEVSNTDKLETQAKVTEGDFTYRLVTEKAEYSENEPIKIYAELEYTGDKGEIEIFHSASPFSFPMVETTRNYEIEYGMNEPLISTTLVKGEPLREEYVGSGGYSSEDKNEYKDFMKRVMDKEFPAGHYVVNGIADFYIRVSEGTEPEEKYVLEAQVGFSVIN